MMKNLNLLKEYYNSLSVRGKTVFIALAVSFVYILWSIIL